MAASLQQAHELEYFFTKTGKAPQGPFRLAVLAPSVVDSAIATNANAGITIPSGWTLLVTSVRTIHTNIYG